MAMNDEETVALIVGGHTFGKAHGAAAASTYVGREPEAEAIEAQGTGWNSSYRSGKGADTITSGLEGAWTSNPVAWTHGYLQNLYAFNWVQTTSPAGATQWIPDDESVSNLVPDAFDPARRHAPIMLTTDLALRFDPEYGKITRRWLEHPEELEVAFARAWFKLTHRDMGPRTRYLGSMVPAEEMLWQDNIPAVDHELVDAQGYRPTQGRYSGIRSVDSGTGRNGLGVGFNLPRHRFSRRCERGAHSPGAAKGLGREPTGGIGRRADQAGRHPAGFQPGANRRQTGVAGRPDRAGRRRRH